LKIYVIEKYSKGGYMTIPEKKHQAITVKEVSVKATKANEAKGTPSKTFYAVKNDKGATFNFPEAVGMPKVGDLITVEFTEQTYDFNGKPTTSRWVTRLLDSDEGFDAVIKQAKSDPVPWARVSSPASFDKAAVLTLAFQILAHNKPDQDVKSEDLEATYIQLAKIIA
jgi:hypothetical protein